MRRHHGLLLIALAGCTAKGAPDARVSTSPSPSSAPVTADAGAPVVVAPTPVPDDPPLAWGTRPDKTGPLYPVVDGMCIHMEVWPFEDGGGYVTYGNFGGGYNRGSMTPTGVRLIDSGLDLSAPSYSPFNPVMMQGRWDGQVVAYTNIPSRVGLGEYEVITHDASGWKTLATATDENFNPKPANAPAPFMLGQPVVFQGHVVYAKMTQTYGSDWPMKFESSPPLAGIGALDGKVEQPEEVSVVATDDAIYLSFYAKQAWVTREWRAGKVRNLTPAGRVYATKGHLFVVTDKLLELVDGKLEDTGMPGGQASSMPAIAPNGDYWFMQAGQKVVVARLGADGKHTKVETFPLPAPTTARPEDEKAYSAVAGGRIAGVEFDDIYAIGKVGTLFHREADAWKEITLPKPPWSSNRYRAETIAMRSAGDLVVNASYGEKGLAWKTPERYRAILRTKRPKETLRCNEPYHGDENGSGAGFMSFPPLADDTCKTPFLVIARSWYAKADASKPALTLLDLTKSDLATTRAAIKATPSLGESVELVDLRSGAQGYVGAAVPSLAVGQAFAKELAKRVYGYPELRPELVCGTPATVVSRRSVTVATGVWAK